MTRFGDVVEFHRGGFGRTEPGPGMSRWVRGRLLCAGGHQVLLELLEDDTWATVAPLRAGEKGWFSRGAIGGKRAHDDAEHQ
jgi:hypothetical protein